jgi:predicted hydrolase (HD superfamily)
MNIIDRGQKLIEVAETIKVHLWDDQDKDTLQEIVTYMQEEQASLPSSPISYYYAFDPLFEMLERPENWTAFDHRLLSFITSTNYWKNQSGNRRSFYNDGFSNEFFQWLMRQVDAEQGRQTVEAAANGLKPYGITEVEVLEGLLTNISYGEGFVHTDGSLNSAGLFTLAQAPQQFKQIQQWLNNREELFIEILLQHNPALAEQYLKDILSIRKDDEGEKMIYLPSVEALLKKDAVRYEEPILKALEKVTSPSCRFAISRFLTEYFPEKYQSKALQYAYEYLDGLRRQMVEKGASFRAQHRWDPKTNQYTSALNEQIDYILTQEGLKAREYLHELMKYYQNVDEDVLETIVRHLGQEGLELLMEGLKVDINQSYSGPSYYRKFFALLSKLDYSAYYPQIWALAKHKSKKMREMAAVTLSKLGETAIPEATALLNAKSGDHRQTGALILSLIPGDTSRKLLVDALNQEKNDDARDLMLESLAATMPQLGTPEALAEKVAGAKSRGKLEKPLEKWLDDEALPKLYWKDSGKEIDALTIRFLLYRQSRAKDIRPDIEAKPLLNAIDRTQSGAFANKLLKMYFESGADAKQKFCLTLGGLLGDNDTIDLLKSRVTQWADASRGKMAEYAVKALALSGTNKALRMVEFFSRKYKSKNKNIGEAARQAFVIAAEELGVTAYELADSIIPDFGFDGLFREFTVKDEPFRAFIDNNFKLAYLNEDNKLMKSPPKGTDKELVEEFKEIGKEIRDIVKSQSSRLEQYLVIQRKWPVEKWQGFFMGNPVMFAYAVRLIWGIYDTDGNLLFTFRCLEDQTLVNRENDEFELPEEHLIGMVHPISLSSEDIDFWTEHLADSDIEPIFPQLNRPVVSLKEEDQAKKMSYQFQHVKVGGYHFVGQMDKLGWSRGSVIDGGGISSYYKNFPDLAIAAFINVEGIGVGYYDDDAVMQELYFVKMGSIAIGSYTYDEPSDTNDPRLIVFEQVPPIVYSEVFSDLQQLVPQTEEAEEAIT